MGGMSYSLPSKNAPIRSPSLITQSPRRSPRRRLNDPRRCTSKTWRLRHYTNTSPTRAPYPTTKLPLYSLRHMRHHNNRTNLPTSDRPQISYRLLIRRSHRPSHWRPSHPNAMRFYRGNNSYNCSRTNILWTLLFSKHKL